MAKKKKTQLKPVARGFATTSVPKKVAPVEPEPASSEAAVQQTDSEPLGGSVSQDPGSSNAPVEKDAEQEDLQSCIDKYQERTEREINRTVKVRLQVNRDFRES